MSLIVHVPTSLNWYEQSYFWPKKTYYLWFFNYYKTCRIQFSANEKHDIERKSAVFRSFILHQLRYLNQKRLFLRQEKIIILCFLSINDPFFDYSKS